MYLNGNYLVSSSNTGNITKRCLRAGEDFQPLFPDSIDLKITNRCGRGCPMCHESSSIQGKSFNLEKTEALLAQLPRVGIELAIGGGNVIEIKDETKDLIKWAQDNGFQPRVTLHWKDVLENIGWINSLSCPIGISLDRFIGAFEFEGLDYFRIPTVVHIIIGVYPIEELDKLLRSSMYPRVLVLGFKSWGRAKGMEPKKLKEWRDYFKSFFWSTRIEAMQGTIGFDNLAIEQLDLRESFLKTEWDQKYFGNEFSCSMYVDAVEETYAPTSRDPRRTPWIECGIVEYFQKNHEKF